jgi:hypothetical protein
MTCMDSPEELTRDRLVNVVMVLFDATAHHISATPPLPNPTMSE